MRRCATRAVSRCCGTRTTPVFGSVYVWRPAIYDELRQTLARAGVDALELSTEGALTDAIVRLSITAAMRSPGCWRGLPAHLLQGWLLIDQTPVSNCSFAF